MFETSRIQKIVNAWALDQNHPQRGRNKQPVPELSTIAKLIEIAFNASLEKEEEKPIKFGLSFFHTDIFKKSNRIMNFDSPLPLNVETVTKLAPSINPETASFAISKSEINEDLLLYGVVSYSPSNNRFNTIPVEIGNFSSPRPDVFTLTTIRPGSLLISRGNSQIGRFIKGVFIAASPTPFTSTAMGNYILSFIEQHDLYIRHKVHYWHIFRDSFEYLLSEVASRSHGSTIVFLKSSTDVKGISHGYSFANSIGVEELFSEFMNFERQNILRDIKMRFLIAERLQLIAQLASIDGALILSDKIEVISYGAKLSSNKWTGKVLTGPDGFSYCGESFKHDHLGTRHNSAIDFVGENTDSIVFVISQDGPIRGLIKKSKNTILCWPDCSVSMSI